MPKIMSYTDSRGVSYEASSWFFEKVEINLYTKRASFYFYGYLNSSARDGGKSKVGEKIFQITTDEKFDYYFYKHMVEGLNLKDIAYLIAAEQQEVVGYTMAEDGITSLPVYGGFFDNATDA